MAENYEPELGQAIFGNTWQDVKCSWHVECAMDALQHTMNVLRGEDNPFGNCGARYRWSCFEVHAYSWGDDDQPFNFKWRDFTVSWYKYNGRGMSCNRDISLTEAREMLTECMAAMITETPVDCYDV